MLFSAAIPKPRNRRTGRPYRPPTDLTAPTAETPDQRHRLAWLLGTNRMLRLDGAYAHRRDFLEALADLGIPCDESRLSRWESGAAVVPDAAVRAYEDILDLRPLSLRGAIGIEVEPAVPAGNAIPAQQFDALIGRALDGDATGQDWLQLTDELLRDRHIYLRGKDWALLTAQLLSELARSISFAYVGRLLAANRLASHLPAQSHLVRAIGSLVLDRRVRRRDSAVRLLGGVHDARAWRLTLRLCASSDRTVRRGALEVAIRHFGNEPRSAADLAAMEKALATALEENPGDRTMVGLAKQLPGASAQLRSLLVALTEEEPLLISPAQRTVANGLAAATLGRFAWDGEPDPMLAALTSDALFHPSPRRTRAAYAVLDASPYRAALADAAADLAATKPRGTSQECAAAAQMAHILRARDPEKLLAIAETAQDVRRRIEVVTALAGQAEPLSVARLSRLNDLQDSPDMVEAVVHALGMLGQLRWLSSSGNAALDQHAATMASWWLANGARVEI